MPMDVAPGTDGARFAFGFGFGGVFSQLSFNNKGKVAFRTGLVRNGVSVPGGIFVGDSRSGEFVIRFGDLAPGTGGARFNGLGIGSVPLSDRGEIAFRGELEGPGVGGGNDFGIWFGTKNTLTLVARTRDIAPGTDGLFYSDELSNPPVLNSNGKIGFTSELKPARSTTGAWSGTPKKISLIARTGDVAPGTDGARFTGFDEFGGRLFAFNNRADFAIFAGFTGPGMVPSQTPPPLPGSCY